MHGLIFETSVWLLVESTRLMHSLVHTPRITACRPEDTLTGDSRDWTCEIMRKKCRIPTTSSYYNWPYQTIPVITDNGFLVNPSTANKEQSDRKNRLYVPHYTQTLEYNKFHYTDPDSITRPTIQPMPDHNLDLFIVFYPRRHGYKAALIKQEHKKHNPATLHSYMRDNKLRIYCGTNSSKQHN